VWIELLCDPPGHVRLTIEDDEIVDRALSVEPLADRNVTCLRTTRSSPCVLEARDYGQSSSLNRRAKIPSSSVSAPCSSAGSRPCVSGDQWGPPPVSPGTHGPDACDLTQDGNCF
jgi:hypothetical protein